MRVAAGILMIIGGFIGSCLWTGILHASGWIGYLYLPGFLTVIGGYYTLKRKRWRWALAGAICSLLFPFFGIPAVILLVKSKGEFQ